MPFDDLTVECAWARAGGRCECTRQGHGHKGRCNKQLSKENRGRSGRGAWEAHHLHQQQSGGRDNFANCEIVCWECHRKIHFD